MLVLHVLAAIFSSWRLTDLFILDRVTEPLRKRFKTYLFTCPRCMSVWTGLIATLLFIYFPWANWPFALGWLYLTHLDIEVAKRIREQGRQLVVKIDSAGQMTIVKSELTPQELFTLRSNMQVSEPVNG